MHTLLLLIFYIPVRLHFKAMQITKDQESNPVPGTGKIVKPFWESLSAILITTSPIITTVLQQFISNLVGE
jgi:hypothetical protein